MPTNIDRKLHVFLCHASQDKPIVRELYQRLLAEGWIDPWLDKEKLLPGQDWELEIEKSVEVAEIVIVCLSKRSVEKEGYYQKEIKKVLDIADEKPEGTIFIIPLRLDDCQIPRRMRTWQYVDYFPEDRKEWANQRILESLNLRLIETNNNSVSTDQTKASKSARNPFGIEIGKLMWWAGHLRHEVGRRISEKEWGAIPSDAEGYLVHGPCTNLDSGNYKAVFHIKLDGNFVRGSNIVAIEVYADNGRKTIAKHTVTSSEFSEPGDDYSEFQLPFSIFDTGHNVEFRVFYLGIGKVVVEKVGVILDSN